MKGGTDSDLNGRNRHVARKSEFQLYRYSWLLLAILVLAFFLRFYHLGDRPLYQDEAVYTVPTAVKSVAYILSTNFGSILYSIILHFLLPLGKTEFMARLPAAIFGFISVWMIYSIGRGLFGKKVAMLVAFLSATSTQFIYFSKQARGYSGLLLFSLLSLHFFLSALKKNKRLDWIFYVITMVIAAYMHFFALVILPVHVFVFVIRLLEQKKLKMRATKSIETRKAVSAFALSMALILLLVFSLYYPSRNQTEKENLFTMFPYTVKSLLTGHLSLDPISIVTDNLKRQLDYYSSHGLFYAKLVLIFIGILVASKKKPREMILFISYILLPFLFFIFSNPPPVYLPADNKFIFVMPFLFLLLAIGVAGVASVLAGGITKIVRMKSRKGFESAAFILLTLLVVLGECTYYMSDYFAVWDIQSLKRGRQISFYMKEHAIGREMLFADSPAALWETLNVSSAVYPDGAKKILLVEELGVGMPKQTAMAPGGLWVLLSHSYQDVEAVLKWSISSGAMDIKFIDRACLIHFSSTGMPLWEKLALSAKLILDLPIGYDNKVTYRLFLAKIYLLAGKNRDALQELETSRKMKAGIPAKNRWGGVQGALYDGIFNLLLENAGQAMLGEKEQEAFSLWKSAEDISLDEDNDLFFRLVGEDLQQLKTQALGRIYFSQAEIFSRKGMKDEARIKYEQALPFCQNQKEEELVIVKIREILGLSCGYLIWRQDNFWRLRWWSDQRTSFSGEITNIPSSLKLTNLWLTKSDEVKKSKEKLAFTGISEKGRLNGFSFRTPAISRLTWLLKIENDEHVLDKIVIVGNVNHPTHIPFHLD